MTGSPMVFQTAPPHPCSNALHTWYAEFDGGADASQYGFGDLIPPQFIERSTMTSSGYLLKRNLSMPCAARLPSAAALTTSFPPLMQSPPAKYLGLEVCRVS